MTPLIQHTPAHVTRRANLKRWVSQFDKFAEAAAALDMSPSQLAQIAGPNPSRNIGPVMARRIEKAAAEPRVGELALPADSLRLVNVPRAKRAE